MMRLAIVLLLGGLMLATPAFAVRPGEQLADPALEARARQLSSELRCLVCQNQSIDDSDAALAVDLRRIVRERLSAGDSDAAIRAFLVARYGDFVLLKPPLQAQTLLLWSLPGLALLLGAAAAFRLFRRTRGDGSDPAEESVQTAGLSEAEQRELDQLLGGKRDA